MQKIIKQVWIDTDIALGAPQGKGVPNRDVDDGWAVASLLRCAALRKVQVAGISVCDGNTDAETALYCMKSLLDSMPEVNVVVIERNAAAQFIAELKEGTMLLALGPLTNIANALTINPDLPGTVSLVSVGGVLNKWNLRRRISDLNVLRDPKAAEIAHAAFADCRHMPLDVIDRFTLDVKRMERIAASGALGQYLASHSQRWLRSAIWRHGKRAFPVWDLVAALAALDALPGAQYDTQRRLTDFNVDAAWDAVESLLAD